MPRFKVETRMQLQEVYKAFGIERAFDSRAQLTGICVAGATLNCIVHACSVEVNEDGAEAAVATATGGDLAASNDAAHPHKVNRAVLWVFPAVVCPWLGCAAPISLWNVALHIRCLPRPR